jgi:predicted amidohydrolase YtcJ
MSIDVLIRGATAYSMDHDGAVYRAVAIDNGHISAVSADPSGLDELVDAPTRVLDAPQLTLVPAFFDNHNHLAEASLNSLFVPVAGARSIAEFTDLIRQKAAITPAGHWIQTSSDWNQDQLLEKRLPTAVDLDGVTREHPVVSRRGGHLAIVNSVAMQLSGITRETPDPPGGRLGRTPDGQPNGILEGGAQYALLHVPPPSAEEQIESMRAWCERYAAAGIGGVRDPIVSPEGMRLYQAARQQGALSPRVRPMLLVAPNGSVAERIERIDSFAEWRDFGDDQLRTWGLKLVLDGGPETGALEEPYASDPSFSGQLNWDPDDLEQLVRAAVERGWRIGTHAIGDRSVRTLLDVYERVLTARPAALPGTLVIEHAFLADGEQRARATRLGVWITIQPALLYSLGSILQRLWGDDRTARIMPVRAWIDEGASLSAGTDYPIGSYSPLDTLWALVTRQTESVGVQGSEYAVDRGTAAWLATAGTAQLLGEDDRLGQILPGKFADLVAYPEDPLTCAVDRVRDLRPTFTLVGGQPIYRDSSEISDWWGVLQAHL